MPPHRGPPRGPAHPRPSPLLRGDAGMSQRDAVGAREAGAPHPSSARRGDGVAWEPTLSPVPVLYVPPHQVKGTGTSPRAGATPRRALLWDRQPGTRASAGSGILWASGGRAGAGVWSQALHGRNAAPEPRGRGGKQRGLGGDMPEPRHAVNSRHRKSNSSAGSQYRAFVSWKPDGAFARRRHSPPGCSPEPGTGSQGPPGCRAPSAGTPEGWLERWRCREGPWMDGRCQGAPSPSCPRVCPHGCCCVLRDNVSQGMWKGGSIHQRGLQMGY